MVRTYFESFILVTAILPSQSQWHQKHKINEHQTLRRFSRQKKKQTKNTSLKGRHLLFVGCVKEDQRLMKSAPAETEYFISSSWPLLKKKLNSSTENSHKKKKTTAVTAVYKYVSSDEFKTSQLDSLNF